MNTQQSLDCLLDKGFISQDRYIDMSRIVSRLPQDKSSLLQMIGAVEETGVEIPETQPQFTVAPSIVGNPYLGSTLTGVRGSATGGGLTWSYQWMVDGVDIPGATSQTLLITEDIPRDAEIEFKVTVTNSVGSAVGVSNPVSVLYPPMINFGGGIIGGDGTNDVLEIEPTGWIDAVTTSHEWYVNLIPTGYFGDTYSEPRNPGDSVTVLFSATNPAGTTTYRSNAIVANSDDAFMNSLPWIIRESSDYGILKTGGDPAGFMDLVPTVTNRGTASNATQEESNHQGVYLPLIDDAGYLFTPGASGNFASLDGAGLAGFDDFVIEVIARGFPAGLTQQGLFSMAPLNEGYVFALIAGALYFQLDDGSFVLSSAVSGNATGFRITRDTGFVTMEQMVDGVWEILLPPTSFPGALPAGNSEIYIGSLNAVSWSARAGITSVRMWNTLMVGEPVLNVDFADPSIPDGSASFVCATGQTVTINQTGNNPATLVRIPRLRTDGVDDRYNGTFASSLPSGRAFNIYKILGSGSSSGLGYVFGSSEAGSPDYEAGGAYWSVTQGPNEVLAGSAPLGNLSHSLIGSSVFHEVLIDPIQESFSDMNGDKIPFIGQGISLHSDRYAISARSESGSSNAAIDWLGTYILPPNVSESDVERVRSILAAKYL